MKPAFIIQSCNLPNAIRSIPFFEFNCILIIVDWYNIATYMLQKPLGLPCILGH